MQCIDELMNSDEPSIRWKVLLQLLDAEPTSARVIRNRAAIKSSDRVQKLLSERNSHGQVPHHPYAKWYGAHWILSALAELSYPPGDKSLVPLREQVYAWLFSLEHENSIRTIADRVRQHASQEGNAVFYLLTLGLADERTEQLAMRLRRWQWPDGGWNCDRRAAAETSSFTESLIPLRALGLHARLTRNPASAAAVHRAAEFFLARRLFRRRSDGQIISPEFVRLHYPRYWHYDILFALQVMSEIGCLANSRCSDALDVLEAKQLPNGGFASDGKYFRLTRKLVRGRSLITWGRQNKQATNEFITVEALTVLKRAGRR